jgi:lipoate-protein ligase A
MKVKEMLKKWRYIGIDQTSAAWNMAVDEALLRCYTPSDTPLFRLYRWERALSFGRFSHPSESVDTHKIDSLNLPGIRRITGGGILVHGGDISYSLTLPSSFAKKHGVKESYKTLCSFLIHFYENLGLDARFASESGLKESASPVCMAGHEAYDIVIDGRKIGGNAQRHTGKGMLQHGTIPLFLDRAFFQGLFLKDSGLDEAVSLRDFGISDDFDTIGRKIKEAFIDTFGAELIADTLNDEEHRLADWLMREKYSKKVWNYDGKEPIPKA